MVGPEVLLRIDDGIDYVLSHPLGGDHYYFPIDIDFHFCIMRASSHIRLKTCEAWFCLYHKNYYFSNLGEFFIVDTPVEKFHFDSGEAILAALKKYRNKEEEW